MTDNPEHQRRSQEAARNVNRLRRWRDKMDKATNTLERLDRMVSGLVDVSNALPPALALRLKGVADDLRDVLNTLEQDCLDETFATGTRCQGCQYERTWEEPVPYGERVEFLGMRECSAPYPGACPAVFEALALTNAVPAFLRPQAD